MHKLLALIHIMNPITINTETYETDLIKCKSVKVKDDDKEYQYDILNYHSNDNLSNDLANYRSVIIDPETKDILCFAPPKSLKLESFRKMHPSLDDVESQSVLVNDIVEGTMINLFWDPRRETWEIATKGSVGGNYWYYRTNYKEQDKKQLTFREMFCDAIGIERETSFKSLTMFDYLKKDYCCSFVLQHPENHIVCTVPFATLYLVSCYQINGKNVSYMNPYKLLCPIDNEKFFLSVIRQGDYDSLEDFLKTNDHTSCALSLGFMLTDTTTGLRSKILNSNYEFLKEIRGNNPNMQFHFFALQRANKIKEFLTYFPMYKGMFYKFHHQCGEFIRRVHDAYVLYYVQKKGKQFQIPKNIFNHIYKLHFDVHLPSLQEGEKVIITKKVVADYWNNMEPKEKLYFINKE